MLADPSLSLTPWGVLSPKISTSPRLTVPPPASPRSTQYPWSKDATRRAVVADSPVKSRRYLAKKAKDPLTSVHQLPHNHVIVI